MPFQEEFENCLSCFLSLSWRGNCWFEIENMKHLNTFGQKLRGNQYWYQLQKAVSAAVVNIPGKMYVDYYCVLVQPSFLNLKCQFAFLSAKITDLVDM